MKFESFWCGRQMEKIKMISSGRNREKSDKSGGGGGGINSNRDVYGYIKLCMNFWWSLRWRFGGDR